MILQLESATAENIEAARRDLEAMTNSWGHEITEAPADSPETANNDDKLIDAMSATALALSIPPAALAVIDLADRIRKRRRAKELIDHATQLAEQEVSVYLISRNRPVELTTLAPDQLLDLMANENPTN
jgi:hypothetical protein